MNDQRNDQESFRTLQLMSEIESGDAISQRELASRLGIAVGLVNSYLKNLAAKGWIRIKNYPRNRYAYLLTPKGLVEKSRLAYQHLSYFNNLYMVVRQDYHLLFQQLKQEGVEGVVFCGVDEVAEIAYLSLRETGLKLIGVLDDAAGKGEFFGLSIMPFHEVRTFDQPIVLTSLKRGFSLRTALQFCGVDDRQIYSPQDKRRS